MRTRANTRWLQDTPFAVVLYEGPDHRAIFSNLKHDEMTAGRVVVGEALLNSIPELAGQLVIQALDRVYATGCEERAREVPAQLIREGRIQDCWFDVAWQAVRDPAGRITGVVVTAIEVTDHVMVRRHLDTARSAAESANRTTHAITSNATLGLVMMDARQYCTFMNPAAEQLFGLTFAEVQATNLPLHYVVHHTRPDGTPFPIEACPMDRALPQRLQEQGEDVLVHRDGSFYPVAFTASPILENGVPVGTVLEVENITARRAMEVALRESERHFRELVDNLPELAWSARADGHIDFYNRRWYEYTGATLGQMEGWGWKSVHRPEMLDQVVEGWTRSLATGEPFEMEFPLRRADGIFRWFLTRVRPLRDVEARIVRWFGTNTDIDDARRANAEREQVVADLRKAVEMRDEFLSIASHELRTPLTALQLQLEGATVLLERQNRVEDAKLLGKLEVANRQSGHLATLVEGLLDVARISVGRLTLDLDNVDLVAIARDVAERYSPQAQRAGCSINFLANHGVFGYWDRSRMEQVVTNLITNAIKYAPGRPIGVSARIVDGWAHLAVQDHGMGIRPEDVGRIFARFERAVTSKHYGGLGLGLYIARQIVEAHGGKIEVASEVEHGSTFTVSVPVRPDGARELVTG